MKRIARFFGYFVLALVVCAGLGWWAIGPTWRVFLSNPPTKTDVLFWTQDQRDTGFALSDQLPIVDSVKIEAGETLRELPEGKSLTLDLDIDEYMKSQNSAAIVVLHKGKIRLERYGLNQNKNKRWTSFSVAKSLTSSLLGAAIKDGYIKSLDDKVSDYLPSFANSAYAEVSIEHLITMTSGVAWIEDYSDPNSDVALFNEAEPEGDEHALVSYLKRLPRAHAPGTVFNYSTGETNLVGVLVAAATGKPLAEYLSEKIWKPFGMQQDATWVTSKTGEEISGCCIQATARDFTRVGLFMLEGGKIDGEFILPNDWTANATRQQIELPDDAVRDYGYLWWILKDGSFMANGIFGQGIFVDASRELIITTNSSWRDASGVETNQKAERYAFFKAIQNAIDLEN